VSIEIIAELKTRLATAAGLLLGHGHRDSCAAVRESSDLLSSQTVPTGESLNALRELRQWHYDQFHDYANRAAQMDKKADQRTFDGEARRAFEKTATAYSAKANQHLRFVRHMNALFPDSDKVQ
jgi:hypothetical protein